MQGDTFTAPASAVPPTLSLDQRRRKAVELRLDGATLAKIASATGLSNPTIIAAHKAYLRGGWTAVEVKPRGRPRGEGHINNKTQQTLLAELLNLPAERFDSGQLLWHYSTANHWLSTQGHQLTDRAANRYFERWGLGGKSLKASMTDKSGNAAWRRSDYAAFLLAARQRELPVFWCDVTRLGTHMLFQACSTRKRLSWHTASGSPDAAACIDFLQRLRTQSGGRVAIVLTGIDIARVPAIRQWLDQEQQSLLLISLPAEPRQQTPREKTSDTPSPNKTARRSRPVTETTAMTDATTASPATRQATLTHLQRLEAESIHIMREVVAEADNPVMLYSIGKDSAVMLHLAAKAFYPAPPPFPLLHIDTTWKFRAMYEFRDRISEQTGMELLTHSNPEGLAQGVNPVTHGSALHTEIMKTDALKQALDKFKFDVALGGARRDEEKSRAKERIISVRSAQHRWDPKSQRPELWRLYNARLRQGESIRAFPLSNWTELDIWRYIHLQNIPVVPLYFAAPRPVVERDGTLIMVDDDRLPLHDGEVPMIRNVRFRTLGCYPLTGAEESTASTLPEIIQEMLLTRTSERSGRMIDHDTASSMEHKKQQGYF